jgi:hypothetical protein
MVDVLEWIGWLVDVLEDLEMLGGIPSASSSRVLANGTVSRARDVAQDAVELEDLLRLVGSLVCIELDEWELCGVVMSDHDRRRGKSVYLVIEEVAASDVGVVGHYEASGSLIGR